MARREDNLTKNTLVFALGNLGSKMLQFFLVPFYTRILTDAEYGTIDVLQAIVSLLVPIVSLTIYESVFRYAMEQDYDKDAVLSSGILITLLGGAALCLGGWGFTVLTQMEYVWIVIANTVVNMLRTLFSQYAKAIGRSGLFAADNIFMTAMVLVFNILFIAVWRMGVVGYMLGYTVANLLSALFLVWRMGGACRFRPRRMQKGITKEMLGFSLPLIPNAICWWISSFVDRLMIVAMLGAAVNGLYAAANKIPSLVSVVVSIFFQAWQVSANEEFKQKDIAQFYSRTFNQLSGCIFLVASVLIVLCRLVNAVLLGPDYQAAWEYMPTLLVSTVFFAFAQFLGSIYSANKKTGMAFVTNAIAVVVNLTLNYFLIPVMGALGAAIATAACYLVFWVVRVVDTGRIIPMEYHKTKVIASAMILTAQAALVTLALDVLITYSVCTVGTVVLILLYRRELLGMCRYFLSFAKRLIKRG